MRRAILSTLAALVLVAGCSAPASTPQPAPESETPPVVRPQPDPPAHTPGGAPRVEKALGGVLIRDVRYDYLWFAGGQRLAFPTDTGLWSIRPDGERLELLAPPAGPEQRRLVGPYADGVLYLELQPGAAVVTLARPGEEPRQIATVETDPLPDGNPITWTSIHGDRLLVASGLASRVAVVDLRSGHKTQLGEEPVPVWYGELRPSPDGRYLAYKRINRGDAVSILDLETGKVVRTGDEAHVVGIAWAPSGGSWAVRAAEPGSGLPVAVGADHADGATHLDVGDPSGNVRHLTPPEPLQLTAGPWWSPDSKWLAVVSGRVRSVDAEPPPESTIVHERLWAVDVATGRWRLLGTLPDLGSVRGFLPGHASLVVRHGMGQNLELWPLEGSPQPVSTPWQDDWVGPPLLPDGSLLFLSAEPEPRLYRQRPGQDPELLLEHPSPKDRLTYQAGYAALFLGGLETPYDLLILPVPD